MGKKKIFQAASAPEVEEKAIEDIMPEAVTEESVEVPEEIKEPEKEVEVKAMVDGVNMALNIRKEPKVEANNQIAILGKGTKVIVMSPEKEIKSADGEKWLKIKFKSDGVDGKKKSTSIGYAMKKYIKIL